MKKIISLVIALALVLASCAVAFAANEGKIVVSTPDGTRDTDKNTYTLYKVFDAITNGTSYSYKQMTSKTSIPDGFIKDDAGNIYFAEIVTTEGTDTFKVMVGGELKILKNKTSLSSTDIANIWNYVKNDTPVATKEITGKGSVTFDGLADGYYYVGSTTGSLVIIDSTKPAVEIKDKNVVPPLNKKITGASSIDDEGKKAIAQVGTNVTYTVDITVEKGAENYEVHDTMGQGLKYNKDVVVKIGDNVVATTNYTKTETDNSLVVLFNNDYIASLAVGTKIDLIYTALVTEDALHTDPAKNTAWLEYGHNPGDNKTPPQETETYNAKFAVEKKDGKGQALAGAGFVLKNSDGKYYKYTPAEGTTPETIDWVDDIGDATEYISGDDGKLNGEFTGLKDGTYTLVEKTVPTGYNPAPDYTFTVKGKDFSAENLKQSTIVVNNQGNELPETGGIGTTIFYILGGLLVVGAAVILVARRKAQD